MRARRAAMAVTMAAAAVALAVSGLSSPASAGMRPAATAASGTSFATSFEAGQPQPTWTSTVETSPDGSPACSGVTQSGTVTAPGMATAVGSGPSAAYAAKTDVGFTGVQAFTYSGDQTSAGAAYCDDKIFNVDIPVTSRTQLSYEIFPVLMNQDLGAGIPDPSSYVSIDLAFSDGTYLSQLGAVDQNGFGLTAAAQGAAGDLFPNQWNQVSADIGKVAAGKTISRILVDYARTGAAGDFQGWIDDLSIDGNPAQPHYSHLADYVITTRGTQSNGSYSRGNNLPATAMPHGFNFLTPETDGGSTSWVYNYSTDNNAQNMPELQDLAISHEPSPWINDRDTFEVMPGPGTAGAAPNMARTARALPFSHSDETARPYYYGVTFTDGIKAEMTPTDHDAVFRFAFTGASSNLTFDNVDDDGDLVLDPAADSISGYSNVQGGYGAPGSGPMYFYATFSQPVTGSGMVTSGGCADSACGGDDVTGYYQFDTATDKTVTMEIGTSYISVAQAEHNLQLEIGPRGTFASVESQALAAWDKALGVITVGGATQQQMISLYSDLYRLNLYPDEAYENAGTNSRPDYVYASPTAPAVGQNTPTHTGLAIKHGYMYVNVGFWDTYRSEWPLDSLLYPTLTGHMIDGFLNQYRDGGWLTRWSAPGYNGATPCTCADVAIAQAYLDGVRDFPAGEAYQAMKKDAMVPASNGAVGRQGLTSSEFIGYSPTDAGDASVDWSLNDDINDFGIAAMASALSKAPGVSAAMRASYQADARYFTAQSENWVNLYNPNVGFFEGKSASGAWRQPADQYSPLVWGNEYEETDGWTYAFYTPQDGQALAGLYGGRAGLAAKLNTYFSTHETAQYGGSYGGANAIHEMVEAATEDQGQWGLADEPGFDIPYFYDFTNEPYQAQSIIRTALARDFTGSQIGQGYPGDEDNGAMSAWYIFSALGIYPLQSGSTDLVVGSPLFPTATIHLPNGKQLTIDAQGDSTQNVYVQSLTFDGKPVSETYLNEQELAAGGLLKFTMGPTPSAWGSAAADAPASLSSASSGPTLLENAVSPAAGGTVTGSGGTDVSALFDGTSTTSVTFDSQTPWVQADLPRPEKVSYYTLTSGSVAGDPESWVLQGSDDGTNWVTLDTRSGQSFADRQQTEDFEVAKPGSYRDYRLLVTANSGTPTTTLAEIQLLTLDRVPAVPFTDPEAAEPSGGMVLTPGSTVQVTVAAQDITDQAERVTWSAAAPAGTTVSSPASFTAPAYGKGTAAASITVPSAAGTYPVSFRLTADGVELPPVTLTMLVLTPGDLSPYYDNTGVSDDADPGSGNIDGLDNSYSYQALSSAGITPGSTVTAGGLSYTWPAAAAGTPDNVVADGQVIPVAAQSGATMLGILGAATYGPSQGTATITYTDGSTQTFTLAFSDWTLAGGLLSSDSVVADMPYRNSPSGANDSPTYLFTTTVPLQAGKTIASVTLPQSANQGEIHVFAVSLGTPSASLPLPMRRHPPHKAAPGPLLPGPQRGRWPIFYLS
jgi:predicted alpha-1,2-mannosidase